MKPWTDYPQAEDRVRAYFKAFPKNTRRHCAVDARVSLQFIRQVIDGVVPNQALRSDTVTKAREAKKALQAEVPSDADYRRMVPVTLGKQRPKDCQYWASAVKVCASINPVRGAKHCQPCADNFRFEKDELGGLIHQLRKKGVNNNGR